MKTTPRCNTKSRGTKKKGGNVGVVPSHLLAFWPLPTFMWTWVPFPHHPAQHNQPPFPRPPIYKPPKKTQGALVPFEQSDVEAFRNSRVVKVGWRAFLVLRGYGWHPRL